MSNTPSRCQVQSAVEISKHSENLKDQIDRCDALDEFGRRQRHRFNRCMTIGASEGYRINRCLHVGLFLSEERNQAKSALRHRLNRWYKKGHRCNQCTIVQRRCQARRNHAFSTGWTVGASEHRIGAMTSAEEGGPTASPDAQCDLKNRCPSIESSDSYAEMCPMAPNS